eukprot:CAMPEP_0196805100 /NCGR_PEP_ID=MMETSP1362-20130617/4828_1 /TAXON_ID=163516 /ORGANISM="Leptocylindrus danicus, Strain CCMP1856" /LENGTH=388 /DNA_ID=CAMNT_0042177795 /DNA_START=32 /DNA_END=1195 /DNA_ORIENTATION=+
MHGYKRAEYKARQADPKVAAGLRKKALQWNLLSTKLAERRLLSGRSLEELRITLTLIEKLLLVNPDPLYLYNHRREVLNTPLNDVLSPETEAPALFVLSDELNLTALCLKRNPKAYGAWFHRKWSISFYMKQKSDSSIESLLANELELCSEFLTLDERNFHCWNYRRFVISCLISYFSSSKVAEKLIPNGSWNCCSYVMGPQLADSNTTVDIGLDSALETLMSDPNITIIITCEWEFTGLKIESNFSNYSAFHYRSKLLPLIWSLQGAKEGEVKLASDELEIIHQAIYTEPDDQSAWWYYRFILEWLETMLKRPDHLEALGEILKEESRIIQELIDAEDGNCKWGVISLHMTQAKLLSITESSDRSNIDDSKRCMEDLSRLDPDRTQR